MQADSHGIDAREPAQFLGRVSLYLLGRSRRFGDDFEAERDVPTPDRQVLHEAERHDVPRQPGEPARLQDLEDFFFRQSRRRRHAASSHKSITAPLAVILRSAATKNLWRRCSWTKADPSLRSG